MWKTTPNWWITHADVIIKCTSKKLFIQIHFLSQLRQVPKLLMSWNHNVVCNRAVSQWEVILVDVCLTYSSTYLKNTQLVTEMSPDSACSHSFSGVWGGLETPAPLTSARVTRLEPSSSRFWNTDNDQEQETRRHCQALCHKPYHVVRELQKLFGLLFI